MRKSGSIDALFPKARQQILSTLLLDSSRAWYLSDLAKHVGATPSTLQRELASLVQAGILVMRRDGNRTYYQADANCPVFPELRGILIKTAGLLDQVKEALAPFAASIRLAFIYGSIASSTERSLSDVDLLVVGDLGYVSLSQLLKPLEQRLSREVNPTLYTERDFRATIHARNHFLSTILKEPKLFIIGSESELAATAELGASEAPHHV